MVSWSKQTIHYSSELGSIAKLVCNSCKQSSSHDSPAAISNVQVLRRVSGFVSVPETTGPTNRCK